MKRNKYLKCVNFCYLYSALAKAIKICEYNFTNSEYNSYGKGYLGTYIISYQDWSKWGYPIAVFCKGSSGLPVTSWFRFSDKDNSLMITCFATQDQNNTIYISYFKM